MERAIFAVPIADRWLVHAPLHRVSALANSPTLHSLLSKSAPRGPKALGDLKAALAADPMPEPHPHDGPLQPEFLGLIPTRACNLACAYCGFGASELRHEAMDLGLAAAAVDWMAGQVADAGRRTLGIHFFGGEPFCAPDVVETAVHRARSVAGQWNLVPRFEVATNGFFDATLCRFVGDYFDSVVLSFDGPEEIHDRHRPTKTGSGSFAIVADNARKLGQSPAELCIRCCVTQESAGKLSEIARWFCESFRPSSLTFETLQPTPESDTAGLQPPNPWEFAVAYLRASAVTASYGVTPVYAAASVDAIRHSFCPVGRDTVIVSPDGRVSACYLLERDWVSQGLDLNLGRFNGAEMDLTPAALRQIRELTTHRPRCRACLARWHCAGGCHVSQSNPELRRAFCIQTRIITACRLLEGMGCGEEIEKLLGDRTALERLALNESDLLADWGQQDG